MKQEAPTSISRSSSHHDDRLENLRWVCPNCDRQLPTFCSKNRNNSNLYDTKETQKIKAKSRINNCKMCGVEISDKATYCSKCIHIAERKVERPSREELKLLIRTQPFTHIGRQYGVNDNTIRKWCKSEGLPSKKTDINLISDEDWFNI